jgi:hypothetical protein
MSQRLPKALVVAVAVGGATHVSAQQKLMIDGSTGTAPLVDALGKAFTGEARHSSRQLPPKRTRRSGKALVQFRKMLKAERKKGVRVLALARKHGISTAYIYYL